MKKARIKDGKLQVYFSFDWKVLEQIKTLEGRKFQSKGKFWAAPINLTNIKKLVEFGFELSEELNLQLSQNIKTPIDKLSISEVIPIDVKLKKPLFEFQKEGIGFIEAKNGRALIADEMGLGKTIQVIAWLQLHPELNPVVIVVPASLKYNWKKEIETFMINPPTIQILNGSTICKLTGEIIIINYDILPVWVNTLKRIQPKVIVTDEAHYYKTNKAKRTKAVKQLVKGIPHFLALSGTPIINRPIEFYNVLNTLAPDLLPNRWQFAQRYCGAKHNGFGWDFSGATNTKELFEKINRTVMIRRLKCNVLKDLPSKLYSFVPIPIDNYIEYKEAEDDFVEFIKKDVEKQVRQKYEENIPEDLRSVVQFNEVKLEALKQEKASKVNILSQIEKLKQLAVKGKLKEAMEWIRNFLEVENKLVIFCTHKFVIQELENTFKNIMIKIDGSVSQGNRQHAVESFQNNPKIKLFVGNIKAAGIGITLTASSNIAFLELPWSPGDLTQAEDRCHRIGQKDTVNIHYLLSKETIEEKIAKLLDKKRSVLDSVLDGKQTNEKSLLMELIKSY